MPRIVLVSLLASFVAGCCCPINPGAWSSGSSSPSSSTTQPTPVPPLAPVDSTGGTVPSAPPPIAPPSGSAGGVAPTGIASCDEYTRLACECPNEALRDRLCTSARSAADGWRNALNAGTPAAILSSTCDRMVETTRQTCPTAAAPGSPGMVAETIGIEDCDAYAARACSCSNTLIRNQLCSSANQALQTWRRVLRIPSARRTVERACTNVRRSTEQACP